MRKLRSEEEITSNWKGDIEKPVISICCVTYNHEFYIEDALEGFLMQETNFPIEILIHDDASTDQTTSIIRKYVERYPKIIKPIYQTENQFSKGVRMLANFLMPLVKGKYTAVCEGDDYWTSTEKLQIQYDFLEENPSFSACGHKVEMVFEGVEEIKDFFPEPLADPEFDTFIMSKRYIAMLSVVAKTSVLRELPEWGNVLAGGHILNLIYLRMKGRFYFFKNSCMGVHRKNSGGITYNSHKRYSNSKVAKALLYVKKDKFHVNRFRILMFEMLFFHATVEQKIIISKKLIEMYKSAVLRELFNFNFNRSFLYFFKLKVLKKNILFIS